MWNTTWNWMESKDFDLIVGKSERCAVYIIRMLEAVIKLLIG